MAGSIVSLIVSTALSLHAPPSGGLPVDQTLRLLIGKFSHDATDFIEALRGSAVKTFQPALLPKPEVIKNSDSMSTIDEATFEINDDADASLSHIISGDTDMKQVCVIKEEISEISRYSVDPVTKKRKISTVEEYSRLAKCMHIKNQGMQASNNDSNVSVDSKKPIDAADQNNEEPVMEGPKSRDQEDREDTPEAKDKIISQSNIQEELLPKESHNTILIKRPSSGVYETKSDYGKLEYDIPPFIPSENSSELLQPSFLKYLSEPNENKDTSSEKDFNNTLHRTEQVIVTQLITDALASLNSKKVSTTNISVNTSAIFPPPVKTTNVAIMFEPNMTNASTQYLMKTNTKKAKEETNNKPNFFKKDLNAKIAPNKGRNSKRAVEEPNKDSLKKRKRDDSVNPTASRINKPTAATKALKPGSITKQRQANYMDEMMRRRMRLNN